MSTPHIAFVGAGNMATSIIGGLVESGHPAQKITAADPYPASLEKVQSIAPITTSADNVDAVANAQVIILAVKPQVMAQATESIATQVANNNAVVISIAAGVTISTMQSRLGPKAAIVRCMPNTPALLGCGASGLFANANTSEEQKQFAELTLRAVGTTCWVQSESELDAITALSGSGPAYFFLFLEAMIEAGQKLGLNAEVATALAQQTALGASRMAIEDDAGLVELRKRVTSPGGTTERAIASFEEQGLRTVVEGAMQAAFDRAEEMAREMG